MKANALRRIQRTLPAAIALLALAILNGTAWWSYRLSSDQIRTNFSRNLLSTAGIFADQMLESYWSGIEQGTFDLEVGVAPTPATGEVQTSDFVALEGWLTVFGPARLQSLSPRSSGSDDFQDLYLLDQRGALIASLSGILDPNSIGSSDLEEWNVHPAFSEEERSAIMGALEGGNAAISSEVFREGIYYQTAFAPIGLEGNPTALVGVRANLLFGDRLVTIRNGIAVASATGSLLVVLLAAMFYRVWGGLKSAEDRLLHQERLAQLGSMVAGVAHEIRNPLGIIEQTGELIRRRYAQGEKDDLLDYIPQEVDRLNRIVTRFLEFARPPGDRGTTAEVRLQEEVERVYRQLLPEAEERGIDFLLEIDAAVPVAAGLSGDAARQILLNLILNSFDASVRGGRVKVSLGSENCAARLEISDEGLGMSPETLSKAREPFFTTKEKGSGLGLALVDKLVKEAGGRMEIQSLPEQGTLIVIHFKSKV